MNNIDECLKTEWGENKNIISILILIDLKIWKQWNTMTGSVDEHLRYNYVPCTNMFDGNLYFVCL